MPATNATGIASSSPGQLSNRASSSSTRRSSCGSRPRRRPGAAPRRLLHERMRSRDDHRSRRRARRAAGARREARSRRQEASRAPRPELGDERVLDLLLRVAGRDPHADERLHFLRDGCVRLIEGRLAHRADELRLEVGGVGRRGRGARARQKQGRDHDDTCEPRHVDSASRSRTPARLAPPRRSPHPRTRRRRGRRGRSRTSRGTRSRRSRRACARAVVDEREREVEPVGEAPGVGAEVLGVETDHDDTVAHGGATPARGTAPRPCTGCTRRPRGSARRPSRGARTARARRPVERSSVKSGAVGRSPRFACFARSAAVVVPRATRRGGRRGARRGRWPRPGPRAGHATAIATC